MLRKPDQTDIIEAAVEFAVEELRGEQKLWKYEKYSTPRGHAVAMYSMMATGWNREVFQEEMPEFATMPDAYDDEASKQIIDRALGDDDPKYRTGDLAAQEALRRIAESMEKRGEELPPNLSAYFTKLGRMAKPPKGRPGAIGGSWRDASILDTVYDVCDEFDLYPRRNDAAKGEEVPGEPLRPSASFIVSEALKRLGIRGKTGKPLTESAIDKIIARSKPKKYRYTGGTNYSD